jgi:tetratricopeptide (TPR) repeat protein
MEMQDWKTFEQHLLLRTTNHITIDIKTLTESKKFITSHVYSFLNHVLGGKYLDTVLFFNGSVLEHAQLVDAIKTEDDIFLAMKSFLLCYLEDDSDENKSMFVRVYEVMMLGISYLELYLQCNYTGPELSNNQRNFLDLPTSEPELLKKTLNYLEVDGVYPHTTSVDMPHFLLFARIIFSLLSNPSRASWKIGIKLNDKGVPVGPKFDLENIFRNEVIETLEIFPTLRWWNARTTILHVRLLVKPSYDNLPTLWNETTNDFSSLLCQVGGANEDFNLLKSSFSSSDTSDEVSLPISNEKRANWLKNDRILASKVWLEWGLACHYYSYNDKGKKAFIIAKEVLRLEVYLTASLGKRTKYQREDIAQLILYAKSSLLNDPKELTPAEEEHKKGEPQESENFEEKFELKRNNQEEVVDSTTSNKGIDMELGRRTLQETTTGEEVSIREVLLDSVDTGMAENIILEGGPKLANEEDKQAGGQLSPLDQSILLALCLDVSNSNPSDGLTNEEMLPYIERVLLQPINWMIHSTGLLERSWIEYERRKTADRAMLQIQALIDQHSTKLTLTQSSYASIEQSAKVYERIEFIYDIVYPSQFELKKDLAIRYLQCQVFQSACQYFRELEMWDEVIACYQLMNKPSKAEIIVREQLKLQGETPQMLTSLADLTTNEELYERAWSLSNHRYPRPKRTLGKICYDRQDYQSAIAHLTAALSVQPLIHTAWYLRGICCMRAEEWNEGIVSFVRCIQLDEEVPEAWTNLGAIYMKQNNFKKAYSSLIEAIKHKNDDYRILENLLSTTLALQKWKESIHYLNRLIDIRFKSQQHETGEAIHLSEISYLVKVMNEMRKEILSQTSSLDVASTSSSVRLIQDSLNQLLFGKGEDHEDEITSVDQQNPVTEEDKERVAVEVMKKRYEMLLNDFEKLLNRIVITFRSDPGVCDVIAEFNFNNEKYRISYDYRVKEVNVFYSLACRPFSLCFFLRFVL